MKPPVDAPTSRDVQPRDVELEHVECARELFTTATDVGLGRISQAKLGIVGHERAGLVDGRIVDEHFTRENEPPRFLASGHHPALDDELVDALASHESYRSKEKQNAKAQKGNTYLFSRFIWFGKKGTCP